jgi:nucleoprotein TPR
LIHQRLELSLASQSRLECQLRSSETKCEEYRRQLDDLSKDTQVSVITSAKQAELLRKVETLSALTDSNR